MDFPHVIKIREAEVFCGHEIYLLVENGHARDLTPTSLLVLTGTVAHPWQPAPTLESKRLEDPVRKAREDATRCRQLLGDWAAAGRKGCEQWSEREKGSRFLTSQHYF